MQIPKEIISKIEQNTDIMDNNYFNHAVSALNSMNKLTEDNYSYDDMSKAANTLERVYKGFLYAAELKCDWYSLPYKNFLKEDHDILGMLEEIKKNFKEVFPREDRESWRATKNFLRDLRREYTSSRYDSYPTYDEFKVVLRYVNTQYEYIKDYIEKTKFKDDEEPGLRIDY